MDLVERDDFVFVEKEGVLLMPDFKKDLVVYGEYLPALSALADFVLPTFGMEESRFRFMLEEDGGSFDGLVGTGIVWAFRGRCYFTDSHRCGSVVSTSLLALLHSSLIPATTLDDFSEQKGLSVGTGLKTIAILFGLLCRVEVPESKWIAELGDYHQNLGRMMLPTRNVHQFLSF